MTRQLLFFNKQAPGDVLMFTCGIRDMHKHYPGEYITEIVTNHDAIWENNPYVKRVNHAELYKKVKVGYSTSINQSNQRSGHFTTGFVRDLAEKISRPIMPTAMKPDLYLTDEEMDPSRRQVSSPYWLVVAGGKKDMTAKIWDKVYWQQAINLLKPDTRLVQVGSAKDMHPHLDGTINLVGQTSMRELIRLVYHADGIICPVTCVMHLAAAFNKPCVVIAGGREAWWWEAYTRNTWAVSATDPCPDDFVDHTYLHTMGMLRCCRTYGCWRSGIGEKRVGKNCRNIQDGPSSPQPACLKMITPEVVAGAVHRYLNGDTIPIDVIPGHIKKPIFMEPWPENGQTAAQQYRLLHHPKKRYGSKRRGERGIRSLSNFKR